MYCIWSHNKHIWFDLFDFTLDAYSDSDPPDCYRPDPCDPGRTRKQHRDSRDAEQQEKELGSAEKQQQRRPGWRQQRWL